MKRWQTCLAELLGTFTLVAVGSTSILAALRLGGGGTGSVELIAPFGFGLALLAGLYAFGEASGGYYNPAVSLAMYLDRLRAGGLLLFNISCRSPTTTWPTRPPCPAWGMERPSP